MTMQDLSLLFYLQRDLTEDRNRLRELKDAAYRAPSSNLTDMPRGSNSGASRTEKYGILIADIQTAIEEKQIQIAHEKVRLMRYIVTIPDSLTRLLYTFRFVDCMDWTQVAKSVGGGQDEESVKKAVYRYLKKVES